MYPSLIKSLSATAVTLVTLLAASPVEVMVCPENKDPFILELAPSTTIAELHEHLNHFDSDPMQGPIFLSKNDQPAPQALPRTAYGYDDNEGGYKRDPSEGARDYYYTVVESEKRDIAYIVKTLANKSEPALLFYKGSIQAAGDRVDHIHPLKFLHTVFMDEELKVGMRNCKKKSMVWRSFRNGLCDSLRDEASLENTPIEHLYDFAASVDVDINLLQDSYIGQDWASFVDGCVIHIPRKGDYRRYNM